MENLDFIPPVPKGILSTLAFEIVRELTLDDISQLNGGGKLGPRPIKEIRAIHHRIAQLTAKGHSHNFISELTGTSPARQTVLKNDPAFADLVSYYKDQMAETTIEDGQRIQEKLKVAAETALDELSDRLYDDEARKAMPLSELRKIVELGADRTVAPPKASIHMTQAPQQITLNIGAPRFAETNTKTIDHKETLPQNKITDVEEETLVENNSLSENLPEEKSEEET